MSQKSKTIKEKLAALQQLIEWFDSEDFSLEESLSKYKEADSLANDIKQDLETFRNEVTTVKKDFSETE